jgi:hypothetical protein
MNSPIDRREFLAATGVAVGLATLPGAGKVWASPVARPIPAAVPESLSPGQREQVYFAWDHVDGDRGLLRGVPQPARSMASVAHSWIPG